MSSLPGFPESPFEDYFAAYRQLFGAFDERHKLRANNESDASRYRRLHDPDRWKALKEAATALKPVFIEYGQNHQAFMAALIKWQHQSDPENPTDEGPMRTVIQAITDMHKTWDEVRRHATRSSRSKGLTLTRSQDKRQKPEITIDEDGKIVTVNGKLYRLNGTHEARFIRMLLSRRGKAISATQFVEDGIRADRVWKKLPRPLQKLIWKPGRGKSGYMIP